MCVVSALAVGCTSTGATPTDGTPTDGTVSQSPGSSTVSAASTTEGTTSVAASPTPSGGGPASTASLRITTLHADQTMTLPATIGYRITGPDVNAAAGYRVRVQAGAHTIDLPVTAAAGTVQLPMDKFLAGRRDLTFTLLGPGGTHIAGAVVVVHNILIVGPK